MKPNGSTPITEEEDRIQEVEDMTRTVTIAVQNVIEMNQAKFVLIWDLVDTVNVLILAMRNIAGTCFRLPIETTRNVLTQLGFEDIEMKNIHSKGKIITVLKVLQI